MTRTICTALCLAAALLAQSPEGHWEGSIEAPNGDIKVQVDLKNDSEAGWIGTISIPAQNLSGYRLVNVKVKESAVSFGMKVPGDPLFQGTVAKEGGKITGELTQSGASIPFHLARTGEAKVDKPVQIAPLSKELEGTWEGTLDVNGKQLRLRFVLANQGGAGTGALFSLDQGNIELPIERISQTGARVTIGIPLIKGSFTGELKGTQLAGEWAQGAGTWPLTLSKAVK